MTALAVLPAVPIAQVGEWSTSTGLWNCTREQLRSAVEAEASALFRTPVLKIGHTDPRFTDGALLGDGEPAVGRLEHLRLSDDGDQLLADLVGMPAWLAAVVESAYPSRSIEAALDVPDAAGRVWPMVVTGLALLGVQTPAIESLGDIADLYGVSRAVDDYAVAAARRVAASALPLEDHMPRALGQVVASASIDELMQAAETWAADQPLLGQDCWVRDAYTDSIIFTAWRGDECRFYRAAWTETGDGVFTFGDPVQVRQTYEPVPQGAVAPAVAASAVHALALRASQRVAAQEPSGAVPSPRGRAVTAGEQPTEEYVPISPAMAELLGVAEDADEQTVETAVRALRDQADAQQPPAGTLEGGTATTPAPTTPDPATPGTEQVEQLVAAAVQRATQPILAQLTTTSQELAGIKAREVADVKASVIASALSKGRIAPASRADWEKRYDQAPDVITEVLASLADGAAVPLHAAGHSGGEETGLSAEDEALWAQLYSSSGAGGEN